MQEKIKLVSSAGTGHYYTTTKNKRTHPDKMEVKKYDPVVRKHVSSRAFLRQGRTSSLPFYQDAFVCSWS